MSYDATKVVFTGKKPTSPEDACIVGWTSKIDEYGVQTISAQYKVPWDVYPAFDAKMVPCVLAFHRAPWCILSAYDNEILPTGIVLFKADFIGLHPTKSQVNASYSAVQIGNSASTEPIETHPRFYDKIGGSKADPKNNSQWNDKGEFEGFPQLMPDGKPNRKAGIKQYYKPAITARGTIYLKDSETASAVIKCVGKWTKDGMVGGVNLLKDKAQRDWNTISHDPDEAGPEALGSQKRTWLVSKADADSHAGTLIKISFELILSDRYSEWDLDVYPKWTA